jgi:hypothetical protein
VENGYYVINPYYLSGNVEVTIFANAAAPAIELQQE